MIGAIVVGIPVTGVLVAGDNVGVEGAWVYVGLIDLGDTDGACVMVGDCVGVADSGARVPMQTLEAYVLPIAEALCLTGFKPHSIKQSGIMVVDVQVVGTR